MTLGDIDFYLIFDLFLLLLIGMGPKIALVPFLELTQGMDADTQKKVANRMVQTAVRTALLLVVLGWFLMRLLHFTPGAVNIAGGIVLLLLALHMIVSPGKTDHHEKASDRDPMQMAVYPLAVPYLLNPAGIATLVIASGDVDSLLMGLIVIGLVLLMAVIDYAVFRNMDKLAKHLDPSRLAITEAVFGVLLAALAVQLMVDGMNALGIINAVAH
ncbi:MAG TPA: MarC family protein [Caldilineae bacterium]|nr:MarC family protein [Caldilineae bacterium]